VRVSPKQNTKLKRHRKALRDLAIKEINLKRKQQIIQQSGFLSPLLLAFITEITDQFSYSSNLGFGTEFARKL